MDGETIIKTINVNNLVDLKAELQDDDLSVKRTAENINAPALVDIDDVKRRAAIGEWLTGVNVNNIAGTGLINQRILERCIEKCFEIIDVESNNAIKLKAINSINGLVSTSAHWAAIQLKMTEIMALSKKKEKNKMKSPNLTIDAVNIQNNFYTDNKKDV